MRNGKACAIPCKDCIFIPMSVSEIVRKLKRNPRLDKIAAEIQAHLAQEQREREAFWENADEDTRAEWIMGQAQLHSPVKGRHFLVGSNLIFELQTFMRLGFGGILGYESTAVACGRHDFMPDIAYWREKRRTEIGLDASVFPAPDFVVEITSKSTEKLDRGLKMDAYAAAGVQEYWLVDPRNLAIEVYYPDMEGFFELYRTYQGGSIPCRVIAGLEVEVRKVFAGVD